MLKEHEIIIKLLEKRVEAAQKFIEALEDKERTDAEYTAAYDVMIKTDLIYDEIKSIIED